MMIYLLKMTLCASLLLAVYYFFLEKEKMHRFKRFYLLFSLMLSMIIPFLSIEMAGSLSFMGRLPFTEIQPVTSSVGIIGEASSIVQDKTEASGLIDYLFIGYMIVVVVLFLRFTRNMGHLIMSVRKNENVITDNIKIVLIEDNIVPHSFGNYIFLNKEEYRTGKIEGEVLTHEMTHVKQKHSLDIVFIELLLVLFWFNPVLYLYKNRIKLNHEFLADEGVVDAYDDVPHYQMILIDKISRQNSLSLTSSFNYLLTKKRLTMMTKRTSARISALKKISMLPLFLIFAFTFCTKKVNEQANPSENEKQTLKDESATPEVKNDTVKITVAPEEKKEKITVKFTPSNVVKDEGKTPPPPPPLPVEKSKNETIEIKVKTDEKQAPPPPPMKATEKSVRSKIVKDEAPDLSSYKVGDKYIDKDGHEWIVESVNPPKLRTNPPK